MSRMTCALAVVLTISGCSRGQTTEPATPVEQSAQPERAAERDRARPVGVEMRNVRLHPAPHVTLHVANLSGRLIGTRGTPVFDDPRSFYFEVAASEMSLDPQSLTVIVNDLFAFEKSPLSDLEVRFKDGRIEQHGKMRKGIPVPFTIEAEVGTEAGQVRLHPVKVRTAGVPTTKLMDFFGIELDDLIKGRADRGIAVRDNDLFLDPSRMLPSPQVKGRVTSARIVDDRLMLQLGDPARKERPKAERDASNFIWFHGGRIRFGRLTMDDADLRLIDVDGCDPYDFDSEHYNKQLVAGFSRNTPTGGLSTYTPDYDDLGRPAARLRLPSIRTACGAATSSSNGIR
jgi:hypothetical protein